MSIGKRKSVAVAFVAGLGTGLIADDLVSEPFDAWTGVSGQIPGADYRAGVARLHSVCKTPLAATIRDVTAEDNRVAVRAEAIATLINGEEYTNSYHFLFEFHEDRISQLYEYMDTKLVYDLIFPLMGAAVAR